MRPSRDEWALDVAQVTALRSTCVRRQVGCVLADRNGHVLATGYNGVARGLPHCNDIVPGFVCPQCHQRRDGSYLTPPMCSCTSPYTQMVFDGYPHACIDPSNLPPSGTQMDACQAIHAEQNALLQCRDVDEISTCYVTVSPCVTCTKLLMNTSCRRIVFVQPYAHDDAARKLWEKVAGREWIHHAVGR